MLSGIRLSVSSFGAVCCNFGGGPVDKGKTGAQLYASSCAGCHKSPQSVTKTTMVFGLESFLREHYAATPESAATIAAYLKELERQASGSALARGAKRTGQASAPKPSSESTKDESPVGAVQRAFNSSIDTVQRTLDRLLQAIKPEKN